MISVVIPIRNERESLAALVAELSAAVAALPGTPEAEWILIDDGSTDESWSEIKRLAGLDPRVRGLRFRRNFGKAAALMAGFRAARGELVFTMDGDLQDDPAEFPNLIARLEQGFDVVSGWKKTRRDPWHKVFPSRVFNAMVSGLTGTRLHDHNCGFKLYRAEVTRELEIYGELHRFLPVLAHARGFRVGEVPVHHRRRQFGRSNYGVSRFLRGLLDLFTVRFLVGYGQRPLHLFGGLGLAALLVGGVGLISMIVLWVLGERPIGTRPVTVFSCMLVGVGTQLVCLGLLAELITSLHYRDRATYAIAERTDASNEGTNP